MTELRPIVRDALADTAYVSERQLEAVNRRGRAVTLRLVCSALSSSGGKVDGALLVMETEPAP